MSYSCMFIFYLYSAFNNCHKAWLQKNGFGILGKCDMQTRGNSGIETFEELREIGFKGDTHLGDYSSFHPFDIY